MSPKGYPSHDFSIISPEINLEGVAGKGRPGVKVKLVGNAKYLRLSTVNQRTGCSDFLEYTGTYAQRG